MIHRKESLYVFAMLSSLTIAMRASSSMVSAFSASRATTIRPALQATFQHASQQSIYIKQYRRLNTGIFMSVDDDDDAVSVKSIESTWNLGGLKKEVSRQTVRCHKKISKANQRLEKANAEVERLTRDPDVSLEELELCPNVGEMVEELESLRERLTQLNQLEVSIQDLKGKNVVLPEHVAQLAIDLEVNDEAPAPQARPEKKEKGPKTMTSFRVPYRRYYTNNKTEIRVRTSMDFSLDV